ncbi:MAG: hypothetical protein HC853_16870 [Anaerolineae bacterium]|nr:hypothetical protein [Anaerolineae bacterium]
MFTIFFACLVVVISTQIFYFAIRERSAGLALYGIAGFVSIVVSYLETAQRVRLGQSDALFGASFTLSTIYFALSALLFSLFVLTRAVRGASILPLKPLSRYEAATLVAAVPISFFVSAITLSVIYGYLLMNGI